MLILFNKFCLDNIFFEILVLFLDVVWVLYGKIFVKMILVVIIVEYDNFIYNWNGFFWYLVINIFFFYLFF